jgi:hypothetical protein
MSTQIPSINVTFLTCTVFKFRVTVYGVYKHRAHWYFVKNYFQTKTKCHMSPNFHKF